MAVEQDWGRMSRAFADRAEAGRLLAARLARFAPDKPVVLALVRGGVPVAAEVARALHAPLEIALVRKIGAPGQPELAIGAVIDGAAPHVYLDDALIAAFGVSPDYVARSEARELAEIERRRQLYLAGRRPVPLKGRTVILVDDGVATGASVRAVVAACRAAGVARLVLAVPVIAADTRDRLMRILDEIVCLEAPENFMAVGQFYRDFSQVADDTVTGLLAGAQPEARA